MFFKDKKKGNRSEENLKILLGFADEQITKLKEEKAVLEEENRLLREALRLQNQMLAEANIEAAKNDAVPVDNDELGMTEIVKNMAEETRKAYRRKRRRVMNPLDEFLYSN